MPVKRKKRRKKPPPFPLKEILARHGWTQYRLAAASGLSAQYINDLANGRKQPSWRTLIHLLTTVGANLGDLAPKGSAA